MDTATSDKLIFPSAITWILCHFSVPFPSSDHFSVMCAIDYATIKWSEVQFIEVVWYGSSFHSFSSIDLRSLFFNKSVILDAIMAQLQRMDAHLDTFSTKLYQVNTCVDRIARWQARLSGFVESPSPPPKAPEASEDDDDSDDDDDGEDGDANSDEMST